MKKYINMENFQNITSDRQTHTHAISPGLYKGHKMKYPDNFQNTDNHF